jgi:hypothetical protein
MSAPRAVEHIVMKHLLMLALALSFTSFALATASDQGSSLNPILLRTAVSGIEHQGWPRLGWVVFGCKN